MGLLVISWNRKPILEPKPNYEKNDTSAASERIAELRRKEALPVPRELITSPEELESRWKPPMARAVCEGLDAKPSQPAVRGWQPKWQRPMASLNGPCCYPIGSQGAYCGAERQSGSSYCAAHHALTHQITGPINTFGIPE